jgi:hypothetical protein
MLSLSAQRRGLAKAAQTTLHGRARRAARVIGGDGGVEDARSSVRLRLAGIYFLTRPHPLTAGA